MLLKCPGLSSQRVEFFRTWVPGEDPNWEVDRILKLLKSGGMEHLEDMDTGEGDERDEQYSEADNDGLAQVP